MGEPIACIEITSDSIRLLVGMVDEGQPVALYKSELAIPGLVSQGGIVDEEALIAALNTFHKITDVDLHVKMDITKVNVVLPSLGFKVYYSNKTTNTVDQEANKIQRLDLTNVVTLVQKEQVPFGDEIIDIIPTEFVLDGGRRYREPPLGEQSQSLTITAMVHALPPRTKKAYFDVFTKAGFRVNKYCVSSYTNATYIQHEEGLPQDYILIDIGARITTVSLVGEGRPFGTSCFFYGGDDITDHIAETFGVSFEDAEALKLRYGYDPRERVLVNPICTSGETSYYQKDLNNIIVSAFETYSSLLNSALADLRKSGDGIDTKPLVFTGGGSLLNGMQQIFEQLLANKSWFFLRPHVIGARTPRYSALLGMLLCAGHYTGSLTDNSRNVSHVSRAQPEKKEKRGKRAEESEEDAL